MQSPFSGGRIPRATIITHGVINGAGDVRLIPKRHHNLIPNGYPTIDTH